MCMRTLERRQASTESTGYHRVVVGVQVRTARAQWLAEEDGGIDDCTAIVCILQHNPMPPHHISAESADASKAVGAISRSGSSCVSQNSFAG